MFYNGKGEEFTAMVEKIDMFKDLNDYLNTVTLAKALPGVENIDQGIATYLQWSTKEEIEHYGFLGIWVRPY